MHTVNLLLLLVGAVCFILSTFRVPVKADLVALGLLAWICVPLIATIRAG